VKAWPRVTFFADSFHGVDGVAMTSRNVVEAAARQGLALLCIRTGQRTRCWQEGSIEIFEFMQSPVSFGLDRHLRFDLLFLRHFRRALGVVRNYQAEVVYITSPGDVGITGALVAHSLGLPLVASWHTNLHEFAARRLSTLTGFLPARHRKKLTDCAKRVVLQACLRFYRIPQVLLAPNQEDARMLSSHTGKLTFPMSRGLNPGLFSRMKRDVHDKIFRLGFVGRLRPEKNVPFLANLEASLKRDGLGNYRFLIVGDGSERKWLERKLMQADFTGELYGEFLARAYPNMDLFVFPSETDTYGNVAREALASGTPVIVTSKGGPEYQVQDGVTGFVAANDQEFIAKVKMLMTHPKTYASLCESTHRRVGAKSWEDVLGKLSDAYQASLSSDARRSAAVSSTNLNAQVPGTSISQPHWRQQSG
jgi:phosphatidylinositol alpha 1,6-mannosyltransferase